MKNCPTCKQKLPKRCKRCRKRWCGTSLQIIKLNPDDVSRHHEISWGTKKCREKGPKR